MAGERQVSDGRPDGVLVGQSTTDKVGMYGIAPVVQAAIAAPGTDAATTQTLANDLRTKLIALGAVKA